MPKKYIMIHSKGRFVRLEAINVNILDCDTRMATISDEQLNHLKGGSNDKDNNDKW